MIRNTTPRQSLTVEGTDLTSASELWVTYKGGGGAFTVKEGLSVSLDGEDTIIEVELDERQTSSLGTGTAEVQVNFVIDGRHLATDPATFGVGKNLLKEAMLGG